MNVDPAERRPSSYPRLYWFLLAVLGIIVLQSLYGYAVLYRLGPDMEAPGQYGDLFGGINAFFTGLAFAGLIYTILLQRSELELQREELRLTRDELHASAEAQKDQVTELQESAKLNALTALLNVYTADLQPLRDITREDMRELASTRNNLRSAESVGNLSLERQFQGKVHQLENKIMEQRAEWNTMLNKHSALVRELEDRVGHVTQSDRSSTSSTG